MPVLLLERVRQAGALMKTQIQKQLNQVAIAMVAVLMSIPTQAACEKLNDSWDDNRDLAEFVKSEMTGFKKVSLSVKSQNRQYKINRNSIDYPMFNVLNASGVISSTPDLDIKKIQQNQQLYAQIIPITKCHTLTNLHVAAGVAQKRNQNLDANLQAFGSFGQGTACEGKESFKVPSLPMKLGAFNKDAFFTDSHGQQKIADNKDWAFFSSSRELNEVPMPKLSKSDLMFGRPVVVTGTEVSQLNDVGFQLMSAQIVEAIEAAGEGVMVANDKTSRPGTSAGGAYLIDAKDGLVLVGIRVGGGKILTLPEIFKQLKEANPEYFKDIVRVLKGGDCRAM